MVADTPAGRIEEARQIVDDVLGAEPRVSAYERGALIDRLARYVESARSEAVDRVYDELDNEDEAHREERARRDARGVRQDRRSTPGVRIVPDQLHGRAADLEAHTGPGGVHVNAAEARAWYEIPANRESKLKRQRRRYREDRQHRAAKLAAKKVWQKAHPAMRAILLRRTWRHVQ